MKTRAKYSGSIQKKWRNHLKCLGEPPREPRRRLHAGKDGMIRVATVALIAWIAMCVPVFAQSSGLMTFMEAKQRADSGDSFAQAVVALYYQLGWSPDNCVPKSSELAAKYALASANAGEPLGQFRLGALMRAGEAVPKNEPKGLALQSASFNALYNAQDPYSITAAAIMLLQGKVVGQNVSEAARRRDAAALYKKAANMGYSGYAPAQFNYAMCAQEGHGMDKNEDVRNAFLLKAAENGYPLAEYALAVEFLRGRQQGLPDCHLAKLLCLQPQRDESPQVRVEVNAGHAAPVIAASINDAAGVFVTGTSEGEVITWNLNSRRPIARFSVGMLLAGLEVQDNGYLVCVGGERKTSEQKLRVYDSYTGRQVGETLFSRDHFGMAYCLSAVLTEKNLVFGVYDHRNRLLALKPLSSFVPKNLFRGHDADLSPLFLPASKEAQGKQMLHCWIPKGSGQLAVLSQKPMTPLSIISLAPRDTAIVAEETQATVNFLDLETGVWVPNITSNSAETSHMRILAQANGKAVYIDVNNDGSNGTVFLKDQKEYMHELSLGTDTPKICFDSASQFLTSGDCMFNLADFTAQPAPFSHRPYQWRIDKDRGFGWASFVTIEDGKRLVSYERINLTTHFIDASIPGSELFSGVFALTRGEWSLVDASGAMFSSNGDSVEKKELGFEPLTVSSSGGAITLAFGGHFGAAVFTPDKMRDFSQKDLSEMNVYPDFVSVSPNGERVAFAGNHRGNGAGLIYNPRKDARSVVKFEQGEGTIMAPLGAMWVSDEMIAFVGDSAFELVDAETAQQLFSHDTGEIEKDVWSNAYHFTYPWRWAVDQSNQRLFYQRRNGFIDIIRASKESKPALTASLLIRSPQKWAFLTPDNYYTVTANFNDSLHFVVGSQRVVPFEQFDLRLNRPDIVLERLGASTDAVAIAKQLREKRLKRMGVTEEMLKPDFHLPELEIVGNVPATTDAGEISLAIKASDSKYRLDRLKVYVNNVPVNGRDGEFLREQNTQALERTVPIKLAAGRNKIQVSVLNNAGAESLYANAEINCTAKRPKPTLYAVAMGVSEYSNPDWNLKYAAKDARDVLERLRSKAGDNYGEVKELLLTDKEVTNESIAKIRDFLSGATIDDTVLMFVAGHGLLDSKYDYYFGTTDIDFNNPAAAGIAFEEFDDLLADLPSLKKSLLIDTCHAGELDDDEKTLLASAGGVSAPLPASNGIAMRSIGTRGMNVKAVEGARGASEWYDRLQGLFVDLRRGSGSTILSSSAGAEYALESSEQQNGLFTYAVLEALDGKNDTDTNKDGSVQMSELGEYVKKRVSDLTNKKQTPNTRRVNLEGDFTLAKTK